MVDILAAIDPQFASERTDRLMTAFGCVASALAADERLLALLLDDPAAVGAISAARRAVLWTLREPALRRPVIATRHELIRYCHHAMAFESVETLRVFFLNSGRALIAEEELARGTPLALAVEPRQILTRALLLGATGIILVHNHPSGDPTPSAADRRFTNRLGAAGGMLGIHLHDHLIVARHGHEMVAVSVSASSSGVIDR